MPAIWEAKGDENGPHGRTLRGEEPDNQRFVDGLNGFMTAARLLDEPRLARIYVYVCYYGPTTIAEIIEELDLKRATTYDDVETLERMGVLDRDANERPHRLSAMPFAFVERDSFAVTPTVLHGIARSEFDEDVEYFRNRYGGAKLAAAVHAVGLHYADRLTRRMVARELDVQPVEGMTIVDALAPVIAAGKEFDPYFAHLFPEIAKEIDVDLVVDLRSPTRQVDGNDGDDRAGRDG